MNDNSKLTISSAGSLLMGIGIGKVSDTIWLGVGLVSFGVFLIILAAFLNKEGIAVSSFEG
jgi:hypothetical protein